MHPHIHIINTAVGKHLGCVFERAEYVPVFQVAKPVGYWSEASTHKNNGSLLIVGFDPWLLLFTWLIVF